MHKFSKIIIYILMLNFMAENMGGITQDLNNFFSLGLLVTFIVMYFPMNLKSVGFLQIFWMAVLFACSALLLSKGGTFKLISASIFIFTLNGMLLSLGRRQRELYLLYLFTIFYTIYIFSYEYFSSVWLITQQVSGFLFILINEMIPGQVSYGATYMGLGITFSFIVVSLSMFILSKEKKISYLICQTIVLVFVNIIYVIFCNYLIGRFPRFYPNFFSNSLDSQIILFILLLPSTYLYLKKITLKNHVLKSRPKKLSCIMLIAIVACLFAIDFPSNLSQPTKPGKIVIHEEQHLNLDVPIFGRYGGKKGGMFGMLPKFLTAKGYNVSLDIISQESLAEANTLVIINLNRMLSAREKQTIWDFVKNGGSLLVLGDHTGVTHIRKPYNDILLPMNISFNFDSAISLEKKWAHAFELRPHYINGKIKNENDLQIGIGASLEIFYPARPVIIGKYAFSDHGNIKDAKRAYLGDMKYAPGEKLGDLVLVAENNNYGDGKVLVFGDTSSFQNGALVQSTQFVSQVFRWLNFHGKTAYPYGEILLILLLLLAVINLSIQRLSIDVFVMILFIACSFIFSAMIFPQSIDKNKMKEIDTKIALIDTSHLERFNKDSWGEQDGFGGLNYNLIRNGYFPILLKNFDAKKILKAGVLVIISPAKSFNDLEISILSEFVRNGGLLILTVGWEEKNAVQGLLQYFNLDIANIPLGRHSSSQSLCGVSFYGAWPIVHDKEDTDILCEIFNYPVVIYKHHFKGGILLVGDSSFLLNRNLEGLYDYSLPNIMFLKNILNKTL